MANRLPMTDEMWQVWLDRLGPGEPPGGYGVWNGGMPDWRGGYDYSRLGIYAPRPRRDAIADPVAVPPGDYFPGPRPEVPGHLPGNYGDAPGFPARDFDGYGQEGDWVADEDIDAAIQRIEAAELARERGGRPQQQPNNNPARFRPQPAPSTTGSDDDTIAESFWPDLCLRLRTEDDLLRLRIDCSICATASADIVVLEACGHLLCQNCARRLQADQAGLSECPFCKTKFGGRKPKCRRECATAGQSNKYGTPLPKTMDDFLSFPLTVPEGGASAAACARCREENFKERLDSVLRAVLNAREGEAKIVFLQPGQNLAAAEQALEDGFVRVTDMQELFDSITKLVSDPEFNRKHTGTQTRGPALRGFVAMRKRRPAEN